MWQGLPAIGEEITQGSFRGVVDSVEDIGDVLDGIHADARA